MIAIYQNTQAWGFPFLEYLFCFRDIDVFSIMQVRKVMRSYSWTSAATKAERERKRIKIHNNHKSLAFVMYSLITWTIFGKLFSPSANFIPETCGNFPGWA